MHPARSRLLQRPVGWPIRHVEYYTSTTDRCPALAERTYYLLDGGVASAAECVVEEATMATVPPLPLAVMP